jgi:hypothetical protein
MYTVKEFNEYSEYFEDFKEFAGKLYANDPYWSESVDDLPEELETRFFLVFKDEKIAGRTCGIINPAIEYLGERAGLIGCYECMNDPVASSHLLDGISSFFKNQKFTYLIGPMNGSTWHRYRITKPNEIKPFFLDNYHKSWYYDQFISNGYSAISKYYSTKIENLDVSYDRIDNSENRFKEKGVIVRPLDINNYNSELNLIYSVCIESFKTNFLYTPIAFEEFSKMYIKVQKFIDPDFVYIAEDSAKIPKGFVFAINNLYEKEKQSIVLKTVAIKPEQAIKGLGTILVGKIHQKAYEKNYDEVIHPLMYQDNISRHIFSDHAEPIHTYVLFGKNI